MSIAMFIKSFTSQSITMENMRQDILSQVSHEFRTPLTSILGYAEVILEDPLLPDDLRRQFIQTIKDEGQRLAELVDDLVSLHSLEQGQPSLNRTEVDLLSLVERVFRVLDGPARDKSVRISLQSHRSLIAGNWDKERLFEMLLHLMTNAIRFAPEGGSVDVAIRCILPRVELVITNNISVLLPEELPFMFDPRDQVHLRPAGLERPDVSLAIARRIVELHEGTANVIDHGDGGFSFIVMLPFLPIPNPSRRIGNAIDAS